MHPLDKGGHRQYVVARLRSVSDSGHRKQEPGNGVRLDEGGVGRGDRVASPDGARVLRMLPGGTDLAAVRWVGIDTEKWVVTCFPSTLSNSVASGVKSINWKPSSVGRQM